MSMHWKTCKPCLTNKIYMMQTIVSIVCDSYDYYKIILTNCKQLCVCKHRLYVNTGS